MADLPSLRVVVRRTALPVVPMTNNVKRRVTLRCVVCQRLGSAVSTGTGHYRPVPEPIDPHAPTRAGLCPACRRK